MSPVRGHRLDDSLQVLNEANSTTIFPLRWPSSTLTRVSKVSESRSQIPAASGRPTAWPGDCLGGLAGCAPRAAISSTARTESPSATIRRASCSCACGSCTASSARACPALSTPAATRRCTATGSVQAAAMVLDMMRPRTPTQPRASSSWVPVEFLQQLLVGRRLLQRVELLPVDVLQQRIPQQVASSVRRTIAGTWLEPGRWAGRHRRSPMHQSRSPPAAARTTTGCSNPTSRDRVRELVQRILVEDRSGASWVRSDLADRHLRISRGSGGRRHRPVRPGPPSRLSRCRHPRGRHVAVAAPGIRARAPCHDPGAAGAPPACSSGRRVGPVARDRLARAPSMPDPSCHPHPAAGAIRGVSAGSVSPGGSARAAGHQPPAGASRRAISRPHPGRLIAPRDPGIVGHHGLPVSPAPRTPARCAGSPVCTTTLRPEMRPHLVGHLVGQPGPAVVHGQQDRRHVQLRVQVRSDQFDVAGAAGPDPPARSTRTGSGSAPRARRPAR